MKQFLIVLLLAACSCKGKKSNVEKNGSFPVLSLLQGQVAHIDTSLYSIMMTIQENGKTDTSYVSREQFRETAKEFLSLPDISTKKWKGDYTESNQYMEDLGLVVLEYTAKDPDAELRQEQVYIQPGNGDPDQVERIIIDKIYKEKDAVIHKNMLWKIDSHFQVATSIETPGQLDQRKIQTVTWKGPSVQR